MTIRVCVMGLVLAVSGVVAAAESASEQPRQAVWQYHVEAAGAKVSLWLPLVAINGQVETYGPSTVEKPMKTGSSNGIPLDERYGRETQWVYVRQDIRKFREANQEHLMLVWVHHGDDHFFGAPELS